MCEYHTKTVNPTLSLITCYTILLHQFLIRLGPSAQRELFPWPRSHFSAAKRLGHFFLSDFPNAVSVSQPVGVFPPFLFEFAGIVAH